MTFGKIAVFLIVLIIIFIWGNIWFHIVETILYKIKHIFNTNKEPTMWHKLPSENDDKKHI